MGEGSQLPRPGDDLAGKYTIQRIIGEGGMGLVFEAHHRRLNTRVAIKLLHSGTRSEDLVARFEREARAVVQLRGRNVARVYDVDALADGSPFMVMEYLEGCDLGNELAKRGPLPMAEAVGYIIEACAAMTEAHAHGIIHRDLTPSNLFLAKSEDGRVVKVLDFGISKVAAEEATSMTTTQAILGTPLYMSPEQIRSAKDVDARTDVWSLGVILYEILTDRTPFGGEVPSAIVAAIAADAPRPLSDHRPDLPAELTRVVAKALEKDPDARFGSTAELAAALAPFGPNRHASAALPITLATPHPPVFSEPSTAAPITLPGDVGPPRRARIATISIGAAIVTACAIALVASTQTARTAAPAPEATIAALAEAPPAVSQTAEAVPEPGAPAQARAPIEEPASTVAADTPLPPNPVSRRARATRSPAAAPTSAAVVEPPPAAAAAAPTVTVAAPPPAGTPSASTRRKFRTDL